MAEDIRGSIGSYDKIPPPQGLKDGGHVILKCSACDKPLIDLWVIKPDAPVQQVYQAKCCYCGDRSFQQTVKGRVAIAGISNPKPDDEEDYIPVTLFCGIRTEPIPGTDGDVSLLLTKEA